MPSHATIADSKIVLDEKDAGDRRRHRRAR
jgi:hypothetical protein